MFKTLHKAYTVYFTVDCQEFLLFQSFALAVLGCPLQQVLDEVVKDRNMSEGRWSAGPVVSSHKMTFFSLDIIFRTLVKRINSRDDLCQSLLKPPNESRNTNVLKNTHPHTN